MGDNYEELEEGDVWAVMREKERSPKALRAKERPTSSAPRRLPTVTRTIPIPSPHADHDHDHGLGYGGGKAPQLSAPVYIPAWSNSKIYGTKGSSEGRSRRGATATGRMGDGHDDRELFSDTLDLGDDEDEGERMVPPHEWIGRKLARSQISSFSVCEGVGRTLKGRDLSRVRNAVLSRTGFLE